jgi:hypothetical protein
LEQTDAIGWRSFMKMHLKTNKEVEGR